MTPFPVHRRRSLLMEAVNERSQSGSDCSIGALTERHAAPRQPFTLLRLYAALGGRVTDSLDGVPARRQLAS